MKRICHLALLATMLLPAVCQAAPDESGQVTVLGAGIKSCGTWTQIRTQAAKVPHSTPPLSWAFRCATRPRALSKPLWRVPIHARGTAMIQSLGKVQFPFGVAILLFSDGKPFREVHVSLRISARAASSEGDRV